MTRYNSRQTGIAGWTLMELMIVLAIIAIIALIFLLGNSRKSIDRANDSKRKTDIASIRRAFEEYYTDNDCYPDSTILDSCGSDDLNPYLLKIPCDPTTRTPYLYQPDDFANVCEGNRICTKLKDLADPDIVSIGCDPVDGCGWGAGWNYCLAAGTTVRPAGAIVPTPTTFVPSPTPFFDGPYACRSPGTCNDVGNPQAAGCPRSWPDANCGGMCSNSSLWCP